MLSGAAVKAAALGKDEKRHGEKSAFPGDTIWLVTYLFTTVLYGGNESLTYAQALMFSTMRVKTTATWET